MSRPPLTPPLTLALAAVLLATGLARAEPPGAPLHFTCADGTHVTITYLLNPDGPTDPLHPPRTLRARIGGHTVLLRARPTASGSRYGNGAFTWFEHQDGFALKRQSRAGVLLACKRDI